MTWPNTKKKWNMTIEELIGYYLKCTGDIGGNLHVVLADGNCRDNDLAFCYQVTLDNHDYLGNLICTMIGNHPEQNRKWLIDKAKELMKA